MHFDDGRVQGNGLDLDAHDLFALQFLEDAVQHAALGPAVHAGVDGVPVSETLGQAAPLAFLLGHLQNGVQYGEIRHAHIAALARQNRLDTTVLRLADLHICSISGNRDLVLTLPGAFSKL